MMYHIRAGEVPVLIRKTAEELCGTFYEETRTERFRRTAGEQKMFVRKNWEKYMEQAVSTLCDMLRLPGYPEALKEEIHEAMLELNRRVSIGIPGPSLRSLQ